ncbi:MAG: hypothetical protein E7345_03415 [Clostridiales bacterium]|nr:hypothetical protein [Clostridiales bacterium]
MKKKFLSFILAICLIIPCVFALTACGGDDEPKTLAGRTIQCSDLYDEFNLNNNLFLSYNEGGLGGTNYQKEITYNELLEMTLGTEAFPFSNDVTTLDEGKVLFQQMIKDMFCTMSVNPWIHFSDDLTKAELYYTTDSIAKTFDVEYIDAGCDEYILKSEGEEVMRLKSIDSDNDKFLTQQAGMYAHPDDFVVRWKPLKMNICETEVTLTDITDPSNTITKRLDEVFDKDQTVHVELLYTVMK